MSSLGRLALASIFASSVALSGCDDSGEKESREPIDRPVLIDFTTVHQTITGFGASSAWTAPNLSDELADAFFSPETGIGLSLLRLRIAPTGTTAEVGTAIKALARGATVWAAPWSPPGAWKTNASDVDGGSLLPERYQDWADRLADFAAALGDAGVELGYLSVQNEPNYRADWETCIWEPEALLGFVRDFLAPSLTSRGLSTKIIAPETQDWLTVQKFAEPLMADAEAKSALAVIATHAYGGSAFSYAAPKRNGLEFWETEISDHRVAEFDPGMISGLRVARMIHEHLTIADVNAWHYWWLVPRFPSSTSPAEADNSALSDSGILTRRAYALGNFSKFVRPGFVRVETPATPKPGLLLSAFRDPESRRYVIVAVHSPTDARTYELEFTGLDADTLVPWITSADRALTADPAVPVVDGRVTVTLPAESVVSLVGSSTAAL